MKTIKQKCKLMGITVQDYRKWLKRAKDAKCEYLLITREAGESQCFPYHVDKLENVEFHRELLTLDSIEITGEVMI